MNKDKGKSSFPDRNAKGHGVRSDVDKEQNLIKQKTAEKAWVTTK